MDHAQHSPEVALPFPSQVEGPVSSVVERPVSSEVEGPVSSQVERPLLTEENLDLLIDAIRRNPERLAEVVSRAGPEDVRSDGWTPFARRLFLSVLADTGRVSTACEWSQMSKQSAYALRARDPLFAAGWDAACEIARAPLADALYEKALDGVTETIVRDGEVVAERHRFDSRSSMAVLNRLDKRCDRAVEHGSRHVPAVRHWEEFLTFISRGEDEAAEALLASPFPGGAEGAPHGQFGQLSLGESPTVKRPTTLEEWARLHPLMPDDDGEDEADLSHRCWKDDEGNWITDFPPPPDFDGYRVGAWGDPNYERACTDEEAELLEADSQALDQNELEQDEALRDSWFTRLREYEADGAEETAGNLVTDAAPGVLNEAGLPDCGRSTS